MRQGQESKKKNEMLRKFFIVLFWLLVWHFLALFVDNNILLVTPLEALKSLMHLIPEQLFWQTIAGSLLRIGLGFLLGFAAAIGLAVLSSRFAILEELFSPLMSLLKAIPVASFVVLFLIWWGSSFLAVAVCFLIVLPNIYINTLEGLKNTDRRLLEMAEVFGLPFWNRFFYIYRSALKPFLLSGLRISLGMSWKSGVAAEVIGTPDFSIGEQLYISKIYLDTAGVFAWTAVIICLSIIFEKIILWMVKCFFAWEPRCRRAGTEGSGGAGKLAGSHVSKSYGGQQVIQDQSFLYETGQIYYLSSPSGSGKTTLLRLLCGLEAPDGGRIEGIHSFSMVFQEDRLCEDYNAVRNVELVTGDARAAGEVLSLLLDEEALHKPCSQLSGGMKRRVALVRAMEADSDCVLLDEPFTGMDAATRERAENYIRKTQRGRILIIATHI